VTLCVGYCAVRKPDTETQCKYVAGYNECAAQVTQYLTSLETNSNVSSGQRDSLSDDARCCLLDHLADSLHQSNDDTAAAAAAAVSLSSHVTAQTTGDQSPSSSLPPPAVYVISPQQVPVTSSTSPAQLRVLPATLSGGQFVLLLARSSASDQHGGCSTENSDLVRLDSCEVLALAGNTASDCVRRTGDVELPQCKTKRHDVSSQSESSPASRDDQQNADDLHMWRPW